MNISIHDCQIDLHAQSILEIFNHNILHTTALYDYHPRSMQMMTSWFALKQQKNFPVLGATDQSGNFLGFATYGIFRERDAYKYTVEHSIYIDHQHQGQGTGKLLMQELINRATAQEYHVMMGVIDAANQPSIKFHEQFGFVPCGLIKQAGYKFNQWLDLALYQLILPTPHAPNEII